MKNYKRIIAVSLAATMIMGSTAIAFAEDVEGDLTGEGVLEQLEATDIFNVKLPTITDGQSTFNYILDPNGLIKESGTDGRFSGKTFEENATLFFENTTDKTDNKDYSKTSDKLSVINKSTQDVVISVKATVASVSGVTMDADGTFGDDGGNLYLALTDGTKTAPITADGGDLTSTIQKTDGVYKVKYDSTKKKYVKELDSTKTDTDFQKYEFRLTGSCKQDAVWDTLQDTPPAVDVVWSVKDFTVTGPQMTMTNSGLITVTDMTAEQNFSSIKITLGDASVWDINDDAVTWDTTNWTEADGGSFTAQLGTNWMNFIASKGGTATATLNLTDGTSKTVSITMP